MSHAGASVLALGPYASCLESFKFEFKLKNERLFLRIFQLILKTIEISSFETLKIPSCKEILVPIFVVSRIFGVINASQNTAAIFIVVIFVITAALVIAFGSPQVR